MFPQSTAHLQVTPTILVYSVHLLSHFNTAGKLTDLDATYRNWNKELNKSVHGFSTTHTDVSAMIFSSWDTFTRVLDDPTAHGFKKVDARKEGGAIWVDQLHPTSKMHSIIASNLAQFLNSQEAHETAR
jgi:lysophospholipase L1-like esterase